MRPVVLLALALIGCEPFKKEEQDVAVDTFANADVPYRHGQISRKRDGKPVRHLIVHAEIPISWSDSPRPNAASRGVFIRRNRLHAIWANGAWLADHGEEDESNLLVISARGETCSFGLSAQEIKDLRSLRGNVSTLAWWTRVEEWLGRAD